MSRGVIRKPSFGKVIGAYRSQWKRALLRFFLPGYGKRGMGWLSDPEKAAYNFWYNKSSLSVAELLGCKPSRGSSICAIAAVSVLSLLLFPIDATSAGVKAHKVRSSASRKKSEPSETEHKPSQQPPAEPKSENTTRTESKSEPESTQKPASTAKKESTPRVQSKPKPESAPKVKSVPKPESAPKFESTQKPVDTPKKVAPPEPKPAEAPQSPPKCSDTPRELKYADISALPQFKGKTDIGETLKASRDSNSRSSEAEPKSKPRCETDRYIKKRLLIKATGSAPAKGFSVGTCLELLESDGIYLMLDGQRVGSIPDESRRVFGALLRLHKNMYGVITDIKDSEPSEYELEIWVSEKGTKGTKSAKSEKSE